MKISKFYFGPGSPKNWFLRFFRNFFTKKWAGIRNHVWDDGNPGSKSETLVQEIRKNCVGNWRMRDGRPGAGTGTAWGAGATSRKFWGQQETLYVGRVFLGRIYPVRYIHVSLLDPRFPSSHSWIPESSSHSWFRIPAHFFVKIFRKNRKIIFSDSRDQNKNLNFWWFFIYPVISI